MLLIQGDFVDFVKTSYELATVTTYLQNSLPLGNQVAISS